MFSYDSGLEEQESTDLQSPLEQQLCASAATDAERHAPDATDAEEHAPGVRRRKRSRSVLFGKHSFFELSNEDALCREGVVRVSRDVS